MTLPRRLRLSRAGFAGSSHDRRLASDHFSLSLSSVSAGNGAAAVVSKKTARRAVDRHLLKRRMLAVMRPFISPRYALVVYARAGSAALPFSRLQEELTDLLSRALPVR